MYIEKYWGDYIGGTDDSLTLVEYLSNKQKEEISLEEIISDTGLDKLQDNFQNADSLLVPIDGLEREFYYAIDLITDLAALLLECKISGSVNLCDLYGDNLETAAPNIHITATPKEHELINKALMDFAAAPLSYNLSEMVPKEDMIEMAAVCEKLRKELYE